MKVALLLELSSCLALVSAAAVGPQDPKKEIKSLMQKARQNTLQALSKSSNGTGAGGCTLKTLQVRREWGDLSKRERKAYTDAVLCLQSKPAKANTEEAPGARSRFDDFVVTHMNQTLSIHYTGTFMGWHRWFTWKYEQALRDECGYQGTQPYWDWTKTAETGMENSTVFDGSDYSLSGNGAYVKADGELVFYFPPVPEFTLPTGTGGGCVTSGPFKNMSVNLGPVALLIPGNKTISQPNPYAYNPRCLKRDLTTAINKRHANATALLYTVQQQTIQDFQHILEGIPGAADKGVHAGPHYSLGGDPGRDFYVSPGDPAFYAHHSMIDLTWWLWQMTGVDNDRIYGINAVQGTETFMNNPPSQNVTLDNMLRVDPVSDERLRMKDVMSVISGPFCYIYA